MLKGSPHTPGARSQVEVAQTFSLCILARKLKVCGTRTMAVDLKSVPVYVEAQNNYAHPSYISSIYTE